MSNYSSRSPSPSAAPSHNRMKACARRCERLCCTVATFFPLAFVYSLTTWAVWVDAGIGFNTSQSGERPSYLQRIPSSIGILLYILLNASYTTAVFVDPGSPTKSGAAHSKGRYSILPTSESAMNGDENYRAITVSSTGSSRYCKKCHVQKPDRAHHCSTCKRCVLKMDHHCPWLATCLGLHNYKAFILFLIYTSLFCWACFGNSAMWTWHEIFEQTPNIEDFAPVNVIMLAVLSGIIGLVITGFTGWHLYLCSRGMTTIECLEKTRYLSGVRKVVEQNRQDRISHSREPSDGLASNLKRARDQIIEFHANAVPGASRYEEGEEHASPTPSVDHRPPTYQSNNHQTMPSTSTMSSEAESPAQRSLRATYQDYEQSRESARYQAYVEEKETTALPNAFDLGWRKNLRHLFGPNPLLWGLPICNTTGDGWRWEVSQRWVDAHDEASRRREERLRQAANEPSHHQLQQAQYSGSSLRGGGTENMGAGRHYYDHDYDYDSENFDPSQRYDKTAMSMQTLRRHRSGQKMKRDFDDTGDDGEVASFQVSGSEDGDSDDNQDNPDSQRRSSRNRDGNDRWPKQW